MSISSWKKINERRKHAERTAVAQHQSARLKFRSRRRRKSPKEAAGQARVIVDDDAAAGQLGAIWNHSSKYIARSFRSAICVCNRRHLRGVKRRPVFARRAISAGQESAEAREREGGSKSSSSGGLI
jgi:hypothetical protein